jgi:hypothetical protein
VWAIPNIQFQAAFAGGPVGVPSDAEVTRNLLSALERGGRSASVRLSSIPQSDQRDDVDPDHVR